MDTADLNPPPHWALPPVDAYATGVSTVLALRYESGVAAPRKQECLIEELPVSLEFSDSSGAAKNAIVMMATPTDLEAFALGFALTEGIVDNVDQVLETHVVAAQFGMGVLVTLADGLLARSASRQRGKAAASSCGLCGLADMQAALDAPQVAPNDLQINPAVIAKAFAALPTLQVLGGQTGAAHAAAFVDVQGHILLIAEDAGRHNALDKLVGMMAQQGLKPADGWCAITSRASFEMVQKAARVGFPMLCAISAPTALAVRLAHESGITVCGFVRGERLTVFSPLKALA
jgi:formate dehydrogenase accessory protein FdhD